MLYVPNSEGKSHELTLSVTDTCRRASLRVGQGRVAAQCAPPRVLLASKSKVRA